MAEQQAIQLHPRVRKLIYADFFLFLEMLLSHYYIFYDFKLSEHQLAGAYQLHDRITAIQIVHTINQSKQHLIAY
jgi:hypothetical protein